MFDCLMVTVAAVLAAIGMLRVRASMLSVVSLAALCGCRTMEEYCGGSANDTACCTASSQTCERPGVLSQPSSGVAMDQSTVTGSIQEAEVGRVTGASVATGAVEVDRLVGIDASYWALLGIGIRPRVSYVQLLEADWPTEIGCAVAVRQGVSIGDLFGKGLSPAVSFELFGMAYRGRSDFLVLYSGEWAVISWIPISFATSESVGSVAVINCGAP